MMGPITLVKGYRMHKRIERFRRAMIAAGEQKAVMGKTDSEILKELTVIVTGAEYDAMKADPNRRPSSWRTIEKAVSTMLEAATIGAESRAVEIPR